MCSDPGTRYLQDLQWRICDASNIYVFRNGIEGGSPTLVHVTPAKKQTMKTVLTEVGERVKFPIGYACVLYDMNGKKIKHPSQLETYHNYVVASNFDKGFKCIDYGRGRGKFLVLNTCSRHIRVLRLMYKHFDEWAAKKKMIGKDDGLQFLNGCQKKSMKNCSRPQPEYSRPCLEKETAVLQEGKAEDCGPKLEQCTSSFCPITLAPNVDKPRTRTNRRARLRKKEFCETTKQPQVYPVEMNGNIYSTQNKFLRPVSQQTHRSLCQEHPAGRQTTVRFKDITEPLNQTNDKLSFPVTVFTSKQNQPNYITRGKVVTCDRGTSPMVPFIPTQDFYNEETGDYYEADSGGYYYYQAFTRPVSTPEESQYYYKGKPSEPSYATVPRKKLRAARRFP